MTLKVLTYNIHKGFPTYRRKYVLDKIKKAIHTVGADIVFLQEIMGHHPKEVSSRVRSISNNQFEFIADTIWPHFAYGKNAIYDEGNHGNAILSKHPLTFWENVDISNTQLERRGILHGVVPLSEVGTNLHLMCIHLDLFEKGRRIQLKKIARRINEVVPDGEPVIIAGDFNDWRRKASESLNESIDLVEVHQYLKGQCAKTFPVWMPVLALDRIYVRGLGVNKCRVLKQSPWRQLSDHAALLAELEI